MDAIVLAGGIPQPGDPLYPLTNGHPKALLDMGERPMIGRVLSALRAAQEIEAIIVVGLDDPISQGRFSRFEIDAFLPNQGSLVANGMSGLRWLVTHRPKSRVVLGCSADIPHLEGEMIDGLVALCRPFDRLFYYPVVTRALMEQSYPTSNRTYATFKGNIQLAGADLFVLQTRFLETDHSLLEKLMQARKHPFQIARVVGWATLLKLAFKRLSLSEAAALAGRILGDEQPIGIVFPPYPELAMDADKPHQVEILRQKWKS